MSSNLFPKALDEAFARLEAAQEAEHQRLIDEMVELRVQLALAERKQAALRRLQMTPLEKSRYIRAHGIEAYNRLPLKSPLTEPQCSCDSSTCCGARSAASG